MSDLRAWLDACELSEEIVTVKGRQFLCVEIDLAERGRLFSEYHKGGDLPNKKAEGLLLSRCVLDPETKEQVVACEDWRYWQGKGMAFTKVLVTVLHLNGMGADNDPVADEVKD